MKKLLLALLCATGISASYAAGLFDVLGSTLNTITGNNGTTSANTGTGTSSNGGFSVSKSTKVKDGWTISTYQRDTLIYDICKNENT